MSYLLAKDTVNGAEQEPMLNYDFNFTYTDVARLQAFNDPARLGN